MDERNNQQSKPEFEKQGDGYLMEKGSRYLMVTPKDGEFEVHVTRLEVHHHWDEGIGGYIPEPEDVKLHHSRQPNVEGVAEVAQPFGFKLPDDLSKELVERQQQQRELNAPSLAELQPHDGHSNERGITGSDRLNGSHGDDGRQISVKQYRTDDDDSGYSRGR